MKNFNDSSRYEYDVALSFAGEDRDYVKQVKLHLEAAGKSVFYDEDQQSELWGRNLYEFFDYVYRKAARFCVIFISQHYVNKPWPTHERRSAQARALAATTEDYLLPARFDMTELPGLNPTVSYIDLRQKPAKDLAQIILHKIDKQPQGKTHLTNQLAPASPQPFAWNPPFGRCWLRSALIPAGLSTDFDPVGNDARGLLETLHNLQLPLYLSAPLTARPNRTFTRPTMTSILHEDFRKIGEGVAFRIEVHEQGWLEFSVCLDELLSRLTPQDLREEASIRLWPGSAPIDRCRYILPYETLAKIYVSQLAALGSLWRQLPVDDRPASLCTRISDLTGACLFVPDTWAALLGHSPEPPAVEFRLNTTLEAFGELEEVAMQRLVRGFGLRLVRLRDEHGGFERPVTFSQ